MVARKGQPNIGNDPAYRSDWRERISQRTLPRESNIWNMRVSREFTDLLRKAARRRGMNNAAYARRAIAAFIAEDLQIPFEDVCQGFPSPKAEGSTGVGVIWPRDDGQGYGNWEVKP